MLVLFFYQNFHDTYIKTKTSTITTTCYCIFLVPGKKQNRKLKNSEIEVEMIIKINWQMVFMSDTDKQTSLLNCGLARLYAPYQLLIRALHVCTPLPSSTGTLRAFVLSCVLLLQLKGKVHFVWALLQLTIHPLSLSSLFYFII